jgi:hypothetical protein
MIFTPFPALVSPTPSPPPRGLAEGAIDEALVEPVAAALFHQAARVAQDALEDAGAYPALEVPVHGTLGAELARQVLPFGAVVQNPEDATQHPGLVQRRAATLATDERIRNPFQQPIANLTREPQHVGQYTS